jgi:hypothetical protein
VRLLRGAHLETAERWLDRRLVISLHVVGESEDVLILAFLLGLFRSGNVELAGSVGDMRDLCVVGLRSLRKPGLTMASFMEDALVAQLKRAEKKRGEPFPSRAGAALRSGRPVKAG